ncbi:type I 3-dehydroquinate dehydratase [Sulfolobus sp. F1]|nr:type I 3-dehydroquinate dehydratase [Sulfolobus sp. F1]
MIIYVRLELENPVSFRGLTLGKKPLTCVVVTTIEDLIKAEKLNVDLDEVRFDHMLLKERYSIDHLLEKISNAKIPLIFTVRHHEESDLGEKAVKLSDEERVKVYERAITIHNVKLIDVELRSVKQSDIFQEVVKNAKNNGVGVILSYHNFKLTPSMDELRRIVEEENYYDANVLKITTMISDVKDLLTLINLTYETRNKLKKPLIFIGMGNLGKISRILNVAFGNDIVYSHIGNSTAPGQLLLDDTKRLLSLFFTD